jgi:uncharacterized hydrophobic protein (TIGR00271 family)
MVSDGAASPGGAKTRLRSLIGDLLSVFPARRAAVLDDIRSGSAPRPIYYVMLGASALIAGFGLLANSPAVVIGAMLVSPLMTPIFGITVGLSGAGLRLLRDALIAEFSGVLLAVALGFLLGLLPLSLSATPEMLARTSPNLLDLFVAALAGLAGCLAMIDERIGASLPGVAIATSLTPPLTTCGLCLALGAYEGAWGAFLLFFANFLAILVVATTIFIVAGFVRREELGSAANLLRRYAAAVIGLLLVTVLLTVQLVDVVRERRTDSAIRAVLAEQFLDEPNTTLVDVHHSHDRGRLEILAGVRASHVLSPHQVQTAQDALRARLGPDVDLYFRCSVTKDVAARGSAHLLAQLTLDGTFTDRELSPAARLAQIAEQTVRDILVDRPDILLQDVNVLQMPVGPVVVVSIQSARDPIPPQIGRAEKAIRERTSDPSVVLLVRTVVSSDITSTGRVLLGQAHFGVSSEQDAVVARTLEESTRKHIGALRNIIPNSVDAARSGEGWEVRAEVVGATVPSPDEIAAIEQTLTSEITAPVTLSVWARAEVVVTGRRYESVQGRVEADLRRRREAAAGTAGTEQPAGSLPPSP